MEKREAQIPLTPRPGEAQEPVHDWPGAGSASSFGFRHSFVIPLPAERCPTAS